MPINDEVRNQRIAIYVDCICGIISSLIAISGIIFFALPLGITNSSFFTISLTFWIFWLLFSLYFIGLGLSIHHANKNFDSNAKPKKKLKAPLVS
jgi:uncharacterized membrane protein